MILDQFGLFLSISVFFLASTVVFWAHTVVFWANTVVFSSCLVFGFKVFFLCLSKKIIFLIYFFPTKTVKTHFCVIIIVFITIFVITIFCHHKVLYFLIYFVMNCFHQLIFFWGGDLFDLNKSFFFFLIETRNFCFFHKTLVNIYLSSLDYFWGKSYKSPVWHIHFLLWFTLSWYICIYLLKTCFPLAVSMWKQCIYLSGNSQGANRPYLGHKIILCNNLLWAPGPILMAPDSFYLTNTSSRVTLYHIYIFSARW